MVETRTLLGYQRLELTASLVLFVAACGGGSAAVASGSGTDGGPDAHAGAGGSADAADSAGGTGCVVTGTGGSSGDAGGPLGQCPSDLPGPALVNVPAPQGCSYCMDATEVTNEQYAVFLTATSGGTQTSGQDPWCEWNASYEPGPSLGNKYPVIADWCDAVAYCKWAGKRLCGRIGGGVLPTLLLADATEGEWYNACSRGGVLDYPYAEPTDEGILRPSAERFDPAACNVATRDPLPVPAKPTCEGGYPGLFDLSGNVFEWEDSCIYYLGPSTVRPENVNCSVRGASWDDLGVPPFYYSACSNVDFRASRNECRRRFPVLRICDRGTRKTKQASPQ